MAGKKSSDNKERIEETSAVSEESLETFDREPEVAANAPSEDERDSSLISEEVAETLSAEDIDTADLVVFEEVPSEDMAPAEVPAEEAPVPEAEEVIAEEPAPVEAVLEEVLPEGSESEAPAEPAEETEEIPVETPVSEEKAPEEEAEALALSVDDTPAVAVAEPASEEPIQASETPAETPAENAEGDFVMDEDYLKAFMEEGEMDDFIYGGNFEERQELLDKIADNAETLAEEGTELLERQAKEQEEKKDEVRYNEKGEPIDEKGRAILKRSLENKLILADTRERRYYNKLKNAILAYQNVKTDMQVATEVFRANKQVVARLALAGYTRIYFALNPDEFDIDRYKQSNATEYDFEDTQMMIRVRDDDEYAIAIELLTLMMGALGVDKAEKYEEEDFLQYFPRREDAVLDAKGKYLVLEEKDTQALQKEKRAEERKAAGISEEVEPEAPAPEEEEKEEPIVILPLTLENKIHQTTNTIKLLYSKLKNELLSFKTVKSEMNVKNENFRAGKRIIARMTVINENVRLYLALDPKAYSTRKYGHKDASDQKDYEGTVLMMKIAGEKERLNAVKLIQELMTANKLERNSRYVYVPFAEKYPYIKNGVFKGDEDKPRVKHTGDEYADIYGELTEHLRSQLGMKDAWGVPKGYSAEDGVTAKDLLELQRSKAKTMNAGVALATPIVHFYDAAIDEEGKVQYLNVQQILNDKFLGKMLPQEYFAIAEGSPRIEELNFIALEIVTKDCNENPDLRFVVKISCRLLLKQETLTKLVDKMKTEHGNLILAFDCAMLEALGFAGVSAINTLKSQGALIMIDNAESASMRVLTEYDFDYLRLDARYYNGDSLKRLAHLDMITGYAAVQNIVTTSINCEHKEEARILLDHGVKVIQGDAVARPMRLINLALTNIKPVPKVKKDGKQ
ncbi:MAG: EAL domain-containing protein [Clostridia bacterium]|nr:EAL domain-containing protein [Clostridia bacterium]